MVCLNITSVLYGCVTCSVLSSCSRSSDDTVVGVGQSCVVKLRPAMLLWRCSDVGK
jgi:hypothetical protein